MKKMNTVRNCFKVFVLNLYLWEYFLECNSKNVNINVKLEAILRHIEMNILRYGNKYLKFRDK